MKRIGITGGIGSGKSLVCELIRGEGYPVYDADKNSKRLCNSDKFLRKNLIKTFGSEIYSPENKLNRLAFAEIIFKNPKKLQQANAIIHPVVVQDFCAWAARQTAELIFVESAILLQSPLKNAIDKIVVIAAPEMLRIQRVADREGVESGTVSARIRHQLPESELLKQADFIIYNDEKRLVIPQTEKMLSDFFQ